MDMKKIRVKDLIALCHVIDDYDEFNSNLIEFMSNKKNRNDIYDLCDISHGKNIIGSKKVKKFYEQNKDIIDIINEYNSISVFLNYNYYYDLERNLFKNNNFDFFNKYLTEHNNEMDKIIPLLNKISKLGFDELYFDENIDFTDDKCELYIYPFLSFSYMDNMYALPNYENNIVRYKTTDSNYKMHLETMHKSIKCKDIILNSLLFDNDRLPDKITKESTLDKIVSLKEKEKDNCISIQNSVDLSVSVDDLYSQLNQTNKVNETINNAETKEQLKQTLLKINEYLGELKRISTEYDDSISKDNSVITKEQLKYEKKKYLDRRFYSSIDID